MKHSRHLATGLLAITLGFSLNFSGDTGIPLAHAEKEKAEAKPTLSPAAGKLIIEANALMQAKKYQEALAKLQEADAKPGKTPFDISMLEQVRGTTAFNLGDLDTATKSFEIVFASGFMPPSDQIVFMEALAGRNFNVKNYAKAVEFAQRYFKNGGTNKNMRLVLTQAQYFSGDYSGAINELTSDIAADQKAGQMPSEDSLQILANCYLKLKDEAGYSKALELFITYYPKREYWADLLSRQLRKQGPNSRYQLDFYRLQYATGNVREAGDYLDMTQLALQAGFPAEAKKIIDEGYSSGILGSGGSAATQKQLRDQVNKQLADDKKFLAKSPDSGAKTGDAMVTVGYAYVTSGDVDKGIAMMEKGIAKGDLKRPDDAKLHLALAYKLAGNKAKAIDIFKSIQGSDGAADVARMWLLYLAKND